MFSTAAPQRVALAIDKVEIAFGIGVDEISGVEPVGANLCAAGLFVL
jgi:hypothetical protein